MTSMYSKLVEELGEIGAKAEMARRRSLVKNIPGGSFKDVKFAKAMSLKAVKARRENKQKISGQGTAKG